MRIREGGAQTWLAGWELAQESGENTEHQTEFKGRWVDLSKVGGMDWARACRAALRDFLWLSPLGNHVRMDSLTYI